MAKHGAEGAVRPPRRGGRRPASGARRGACAPRSRSSGRRSRSSDRSCRRGPTCCRPSSSRSSRRCRTTCRRSPRSRSSTVMEQELGVPWEDVFESIDPKPLAAGTIARGAPGHARRRRARRREGPAPDRAGGHRCRTSALLELFAEKVGRPPGVQAGDRHAAPCSSTCPTRCSASSTSGRRRRTSSACARCSSRYPRLGVPERVRRPLDVAAAGDGGDPGRADPRGARGPPSARRRRASCSSPTTGRSSPTASSTPTRTPGT